jgi:hypothetical protein
MLGFLGTAIMYVLIIVIAGMIFIKIFHTPKDKRQSGKDSSEANKSS